WSNPDKSGLVNRTWRGTNEELVLQLLGLSSQQHRQHGLETRDTEERPDALPQFSIPDSFRYIASRLGVVRCKTLQLGSPFDYAEQATLYIESNLPEPNDTTRFLPAAGERILKYLRQTHGGA